MPQVRRFESESYASIGDLLHEASVDLLPEELRSNEHAGWVVKNDPLLQSKYRASDENSSPFAIVGDFVASRLQQRIPFYFAALFHIGRMLSVANVGLQNIQALTREENWQASLANILALSRPRLSFLPTGEQRETEVLLRTMCDLGISNFQNEIRIANKWWHIWLDEVARLKASVDKYEYSWRNVAEYSNDRYNRSRGFGDITELCFAAWSVSAACSAKSTLAEEMTQTGVRLKADDCKPVTPLIGIGQFVPMISAILSSDADWGDLRHEVYHLSRLMEEWIGNEKEQRMQPELDIALSILKAKYGDANPFAEYTPCGQIATRELRTLVREHRLPNGRPSPWVAEWKNSLESPLSFNSYSPLMPPKDLTESQLEMMIRAVDSTIKIHVGDNITQPASWEQFLQTLFESHCVKQFGEGAGEANKKQGKTFKTWSAESFSEFIIAITNGINRLGYELNVPPLGRLRVLLEKATQGESLYGDDAW